MCSAKTGQESITVPPAIKSENDPQLRLSENHRAHGKAESCSNVVGATHVGLNFQLRHKNPLSQAVRERAQPAGKAHTAQ